MSSKKYYVYILQSEKDQSFYVGYTQNITQRLKHHNKGKVRYTKSHVPYRLIYLEEFLSKEKAKLREKYIKHYARIKSFLKTRVPPKSTLIDFGTSPESKIRGNPSRLTDCTILDIIKLWH
ncbi:GIY-YIG nuclease family protein [Patescibacteria group bacterium]|nr:GIY-YIG nuclease family protein [Patescibacteria group bacterium]